MTVELEGLQSAKKIVQWMGIGVMPSQANAQLASEAIRGAEAPQALGVLSAIGMGLAPRADLCREAISQLDNAIDQAREFKGTQPRERFDRG